MLTCSRMDLAENHDELHAIIEYVSVTLQNVKMVRESVPDDQICEIEAGDEISVYSINGPVSTASRRLTIWYNKEMAAIETFEGSIRGDWNEAEEVLLTGEQVQAQNVDGSSVNGRIAYNLYGIKGIYSSGGDFYHLIPPEGKHGQQ